MLRVGSLARNVTVTVLATIFAVATVRADHEPGHRESGSGNSTVVVIPTRLAMSASMAEIRMQVSKEFYGEPQTRTLPLDDPSLVGRVNRVTREMEMAGWTHTDTRDSEGRPVRRFTRPGQRLATFTSRTTIAGAPPRPAVVTGNLDVAVNLKKPPWADIRRATTVNFASNLDEATRNRLRNEYKRWISSALDRAIAARERQHVVLASDKKAALRQPRRTSVSQDAPFRIDRFEGRIVVTVSSQLIDIPLGLP